MMPIPPNVNLPLRRLSVNGLFRAGIGDTLVAGQIRANLAQVMRGILFPNSNVIGAA
jgi:hypothetical protein